MFCLSGFMASFMMKSVLGFMFVDMLVDWLTGSLTAMVNEHAMLPPSCFSTYG